MVEKMDLFSYKLKGFFQVWFAQWKDESVIDVSYLDCNKFK